MCLGLPFERFCRGGNSENMTDTCIFLYKCNLIMVHESQIFLSVSICFLFCPPVSLREQLRDCSESAHTRKQEDEKKKQILPWKKLAFSISGCFWSKNAFLHLFTDLHTFKLESFFFRTDNLIAQIVVYPRMI